MTNHLEQIKLGVDGLSIVTVLGALAGILPAVAALFTIIWTAIRIYETKTVQRLIKKKKNVDGDENN